MSVFGPHGCFLIEREPIAETLTAMGGVPVVACGASLSGSRTAGGGAGACGSQATEARPDGYDRLAPDLEVTRDRRAVRYA